MTITLVKDNICNINADAIVNAANETLEGGGGVDYHIHKNAGEELLYACKKLPIKTLKRSTVVDVGRCDVGEVIITPSFNINTAKYIFHTVAPILNDDNSYNECHFQLCYDNLLKTAVGMKLNSICFCCLGTGFYGFPKDKAAEIAMNIFKQYNNIDIIISVIDDIDYNLYYNLINE